MRFAGLTNTILTDERRIITPTRSIALRSVAYSGRLQRHVVVCARLYCVTRDTEELFLLRLHLIRGDRQMRRERELSVDLVEVGLPLRVWN